MKTSKANVAVRSAGVKALAALALASALTLGSCGDDSSNPSASVEPKKNTKTPGETKPGTVDNDKTKVDDGTKVPTGDVKAETTTSDTSSTTTNKLLPGKVFKDFVQGSWNSQGQGCVSVEQSTTIKTQGIETSLAAAVEYKKIAPTLGKGQVQVGPTPAPENFQRIIVLEDSNAEILENVNGVMQQIAQGQFSVSNEQQNAQLGWSKAQVKLPTTQQEFEASLYDSEANALYITQVDGTCQSGKALEKFQRSVSNR